ncbi:MAG TPA: TIGR00730 family Rossman fold protein [Bdellovibrionales bacterium]|nr:TIGR00730 family Rossman fold protein [Bdellovibrionales bacterium]
MKTSVGVFLSASDRVSPSLLEEAKNFGSRLAEKGFHVVYGGASCGSMGALAQGVLEKKGTLTGVIPEIDILQELVRPNLTEKIVVPKMSDRKEQLMEKSDAFVFFPGGLGTLDEITEVLCLKSLGAKNCMKPVVFYNYLGFWTPFLESLEIMCEQRVISGPLDQMYQVFETSEEVLGYLSDQNQ